MLVATVGCIACSNGLLLFVHNEDEETVFLECEECMTTYACIAVDGRIGDLGWANDITGRTRFASEADVRARGWAALIARELPDGYSGDAVAGVEP